MLEKLAAVHGVEDTGFLAMMALDVDREIIRTPQEAS